MKVKLFNLTLFSTIIFTTCTQAAESAKHIPGVFIGATHVESETEFTFGFEYELSLIHI